jgi:acyl-CoA hydrolase
MVTIAPNEGQQFRLSGVMLMKEQGKRPSDSAVESRYLVMPHHANQYGTAFGGAIVAWMDITASMAAQRHCGKEAVTAGIDAIDFHQPVYVGEQVVLRASVNYVGRTSMEIGVQVIKENPYNGQTVLATTAHLTFVALDENKKPTPVPPLIPETEDEKRRYENARIRVLARRDLLKKMK